MDSIISFYLNFKQLIFGGIIGFLIAYYFYRKSNKKKKLYYEVRNDQIFDSSFNSELLDLKYDGHTLNGLSQAKILIENVGNLPILKADVSEISPLAIYVNPKNKILDIQVYSSDKDINTTLYQVDKNSLYEYIIDFDFINPKGYLFIIILHDGAPAESVKVKARFQGTKVLKEYKDKTKNKLLIIIFLGLLLMIPILVGTNILIENVLDYFGFDKMKFIFKQLIILVPTMLIGYIFSKLILLALSKIKFKHTDVWNKKWK